MGGISVILIMIPIMIVLMIAFIMAGIMAIVMFIVATILTIFFIVKKEERKVNGKQLGGKVAIPIILYLISIPILIFEISVIFSSYQDLKTTDDEYYDRYNQNRIIDYEYNDLDYIYDTI